MIGKLIGLATVGGALASASVLHRFLSGIAGVVMLAIISAFMLCALLTGAFYLAYVGLVYYGLNGISVAIILTGLALIITIALIAVTYQRLNKLRDISHRELPRTDTYLLDAGDIAIAFLDGFLNSRG
jgi:ABC-type Co2+ transport system permease subunit